MVGPLLLLKMLHCKRTSKRLKIPRIKKIKRSSTDTDSGQQSSIEVCVKGEDIESENLTCRVCLKEGIIPIFNTSGGDDFSEAVKNFGSIEFHTDDEYPKYLCQSCYDLLQGAILFRKTAQQSDYQLRHHVLSIEKQKTESDNDQIDNDHPNDIEYEYEEEKKVKHDDMYRCKTCNLDFHSFEDYAEHRASQEHEDVRHTCLICQKSYTTLYIKRHMALHKREKIYMCDICGKEFTVQGHFSRHRLTHFNDLPFKCSLCPYRGRFTESLKMHMRSHTGEKPYQCSTCPSKFTNKSNLNKHMFTHAAKHDFKCEDCGRGFYTKRNLELHFKVDHTGIKDHVCNICGKQFGYRKQMMKHQLNVHKREKLRSGRLPLYLQIKSKEQQKQPD